MALSVKEGCGGGREALPVGRRISWFGAQVSDRRILMGGNDLARC